MSAAPHPFRIANFRAYWAARLTMTLAQNSMIIIIGWQTYTIARQMMSLPAAAAQLGLIGLLQFLPLFVTTPITGRSEEHTSELQSLMRISSAVFCLKKKKHN